MFAIFGHRGSCRPYYSNLGIFYLKLKYFEMCFSNNFTMLQGEKFCGAFPAPLQRLLALILLHGFIWLLQRDDPPLLLGQSKRGKNTIA